MAATERARGAFRFVVSTGLAGQHLLFDLPLIRRTFIEEAEALQEGREDWPERVHRVLEQISGLPSLDEQRNFIALLPGSLQARLCFHYFELLDAESTQCSGELH